MSLEIIRILNFLISALLILIVIEVIVANIMAFGRGLSPYHPAVQLLRRIVNPILEPFRRILPPSKTGGWDLSPMLVMLILYAVRGMINGIR